MAMQQTNDEWQTSRWHSGFVPIADGARRIFATTAGQKRLPQQQTGELPPLVIIEPGLGGVAAEHIVVAQLIAPFARVLRYDRAGYGSSTFRDGTPDTISATDRARDLSLLLENMALPPPYVLVGQSFGGTLIREFLEQRGSTDVVGMVLVDCIPLVQGIEELERLIGSLLGDGTGATYGEAIGLSENNVLTPEQEEQRKSSTEIAETNGTIHAESKVARQSQALVNETQGMQSEVDDTGWVTKLSFTKASLGKGRLSVVLGDFERDFRNLIEFGKSRGYGDETTYRDAVAYLERCRPIVRSCQEAQLALTAGQSRVIKAPGTGRTHNLHLTRPDVVAKEVQWVMEGVLGDLTDD